MSEGEAHTLKYGSGQVGGAMRQAQARNDAAGLGIPKGGTCSGEMRYNDNPLASCRDAHRHGVQIGEGWPCVNVCRETQNVPQPSVGRTTGQEESIHIPATGKGRWAAGQARVKDGDVRYDAHGGGGSDVETRHSLRSNAGPQFKTGGIGP